MTLRSAILIAPALLCAVVALPAQAADPSQCQRLRGKDLAPARHVKLVVRPSTERRLADGRRAAKLVGCVLPRGPLRRIGTREGIDNDVAQDYDFTIVQVQGRIVLLSQQGSQIGYQSHEATRVWNLDSGRAYDVARACSDKYGSCTGQDEYRLGTAFVTRRGDAVAALVRHPADGSTPTTVVVASFATDGTRTLRDAGTVTTLSPTSLSLTGNLASWTNAGMTRSADIRTRPPA
ncbi:MAG TPA: hypothetical protein VEX67_01530 [Solirubrobacteraceae bacterium]|nr:hypothetical protein [Solirubrobacteraceae bacterium]